MIHETAIVHSGARIAQNVEIGPYAEYAEYPPTDDMLLIFASLHS